jgi:predicted lipoprotein with Yx(FWY)xxD motif
MRFLTALILSFCVAWVGFAPAHAEDSAGPAGIVVNKHGDGWHFADAKGLALYVYDKDEVPGKSQCNGECAKLWPPYAAADDAKPLGGWDIIVRQDGVHQWTYRGKPVYSYAKDQTPDTTFGDNFGASWHVAFQPISIPPEAAMGKTNLGTVLVGVNGLTLYSLDDGKSCAGACMANWTALSAPWAAIKNGDWDPVVVPDGTKQWAYKGKLLYSYSGDVVPGDVTGQDVGKIWHAAILEPTPPNPDWVTFVESDGGEIVANKQGLTIYTFNRTTFFIGGPPYPEKTQNLALQGICDAYCRGNIWVPVIAAPDAKSMGNWTVMDMKEDGFRQWAYKGKPLYTDNEDKAPGEFHGTTFGDNSSWRPIKRSGGSMQGVSPVG